MSSFFLSYSSKNLKDAVRIQELLEARGNVAVFRDKDADKGIPPGAKWLSELFANINRAEVVVFLASPDSLASAWCQTELAYAIARGKYVVPICRVAVSAHPLLRDRQVLGPINRLATLVDQLLAGLARTGHGSDDSFTWDPNASPYPGLRSLQEGHAAVFFGRDVERVGILDRVAEPQSRSILVVGPSGSGKSSLVCAGVLPRLTLQKGMIVLPAVTPGEHPLRRIADAFHDVDPALDVEALVADRTAFAAAVDRLVSSGGRVVLFIDQAEDLISLTAPDQAADVAARLGAIDRERLAVIFALRSASLDAWQRHPGLAGLTPDDPIWVNSLNRAGLREVILGPANVAGITFEPPELVERILDDTVDGYALPLLAALLEELTKGYTREAPTVITTELYRRIGPVDRIIVRRAAAATGLIRADLRLGEEAAVNAYLRLVEIDDHGQAVRAEVAAKDLSKTDQKIFEAFEKQSLVTRDVEAKPAVGDEIHERVGA